MAVASPGRTARQHINPGDTPCSAGNRAFAWGIDAHLPLPRNSKGSGKLQALEWITDDPGEIPRPQPIAPQPTSAHLRPPPPIPAPRSAAQRRAEGYADTTRPLQGVVVRWSVPSPSSSSSRRQASAKSRSTREGGGGRERGQGRAGHGRGAGAGAGKKSWLSAAVIPESPCFIVGQRAMWRPGRPRPAAGRAGEGEGPHAKPRHATPRHATPCHAW